MILLSIKPKYVDKIISGDKKFEFRKSIFKYHVDKIYIYSSSPVKQIIGYFYIDKIIEDHPDNLWKKHKKYAGINKDDFFKYFSGKQTGYAIKIGELKLFDEPINPNTVIDNFKPPQSFYYIDENIFTLSKS